MTRWERICLAVMVPLTLLLLLAQAVLQGHI